MVNMKVKANRDMGREDKMDLGTENVNVTVMLLINNYLIHQNSSESFSSPSAMMFKKPYQLFPNLHTSIVKKGCPGPLFGRIG